MRRKNGFLLFRSFQKWAIECGLLPHIYSWRKLFLINDLFLVDFLDCQSPSVRRSAPPGLEDGSTDPNGSQRPLLVSLFKIFQSVCSLQSSQINCIILAVAATAETLCILWPFEFERTEFIEYVAIAIVTLFSCIAMVASIGHQICIDRDWVPEIFKGDGKQTLDSHF